MNISIIQPARNNLKYLKWSYDSIRRNQGDHTVEICVADDFSDDGTDVWCQDTAERDEHFKWMRNAGPKRLGHTILYDDLVNRVATHDICMIFHADMYLCPVALDAIEKNIGNSDSKTIVSLTRIEPPLHPPGPEKIIMDFGIETEEFDEDALLLWLVHTDGEYKNTEGIFAPWAFWKKDFQEIGGHDPLFAPQSKEDSDIFNRFQLNGVKFIQTWEGYVYHMTCRGSRFADGATRNPAGQVFMKNRETDEWLIQNQKSTRNFIRKWGHMVKHDEYMKPIIPPKYIIKFKIDNCTQQLLHIVEPWASRIECDLSEDEIDSYIKSEQDNTLFDLREHINNFYDGGEMDFFYDVIVNIDGNTYIQSDHDITAQLSEIIKDSGEIGEFKIGNLLITINKLEDHSKELIFINK